MKVARGVLVVLGLFAAFSAGLATGRLVEFGRRREPRAEQQIREGSGGFTNPLLECEIANEQLYVTLRPFNGLLDELIASLKADRRVSMISVYFRDLNNGPWIGRHEKEEYIPASLAKLPVVIACYRLADSVPDFLSRRIVYEGLDEERDPGFVNPESNMQRGKAYTVDELILRVAKFSDNAAANLLMKALPPRQLQQVYFDLGIDPRRLATGEFSLSPKEYSAFFRILYNASYLSKRLSEQALQYFAQSTFELGLVAGVPDGTPVSHKFGVLEQASLAAPPRLQLHDCGIVYHPQRPYLLCVMTSGDDYVNMAAAIAAVSRLAYQEVDRSLIRPGDWGAMRDGKTSFGEQ